VTFGSSAAAYSASDVAIITNGSLTANGTAGWWAVVSPTARYWRRVRGFREFGDDRRDV
jgi:hypothetical protein